MDVRGLYGDALAAVEEARMHGYSQSAAVLAALDHLEGASRDEAVVIASVLAGWIASDLNPSSVKDLGGWVEAATAVLAGREVVAR